MSKKNAFPFFMFFLLAHSSLISGPVFAILLPIMQLSDGFG